MKVGVLALQGAFTRQTAALSRLGATTVEVRTPETLEGVDALVMPGGESSTMSMLLDLSGMSTPIRERLAEGMPVLGICAGMILLSSTISDGRSDQVPLGAIDIDVRRNGYGRQIDSFETDLEIDGLDGSFHGVFIRAPVVERVGEAVDVLATVDRQPVLCRQGSVLVAAFHPELVDDDRVHRVFMDRAFA
ncbi:MAG: pyridoxal 5'-phosphate synthase glutaminase subunit PdxT [Actinomycetota bacterium]|nr:pyridoxal 5'-phosphate synthase glutaminase subunit PdxT [Actinomycetota bacterium]